MISRCLVIFVERVFARITLICSNSGSSNLGLFGQIRKTTSEFTACRFLVEGWFSNICESRHAHLPPKLNFAHCGLEINLEAFGGISCAASEEGNQRAVSKHLNTLRLFYLITGSHVVF